MHQPTKICTKCGRQLAATAEWFHRDKSTKDGLQCWCKSCQKIYYEAHTDEKKTYDKARRQARKEEIKTQVKAYKEAHKDEIAAYLKNYRKTYDQTHQKQINAKTRRYYARKKELTVGEFDKREWLELQPKPYRCYLCGKIIGDNEPYEIDHRIPLSRGGPHMPWNLGITHSTCNKAKHTKTPSEYLPDRFPPELPL